MPQFPHILLFPKCVRKFAAYLDLKIQIIYYIYQMSPLLFVRQEDDTGSNASDALLGVLQLLVAHDMKC